MKLLTIAFPGIEAEAYIARNSDMEMTVKTMFFATGLALAALAAPQVVAAQDRQPQQEILVTGKYKKDWDKGNKLEAEGLKELQEAKRELVKYSAAVVNAQDLRDTSRERAENARAAFESLVARPYFSSSKEALSWARQVERAAADWAKFDERSEEGAKDLKKAQERQEKAQKAYDKAQAKIDKGRAMKLEAEQASRLQAASE